MRSPGCGSPETRSTRSFSEERTSASRLGLTLSAEDSLRLGLANAVVPTADVLATALAWAEEIAQNAPLAVQTTKRMMRLGQDETFETTVDHLLMHFRTLTQMDDFAEALRAYAEKRPARFTGR